MENYKSMLRQRKAASVHLWFNKKTGMLAIVDNYNKTRVEFELKYPKEKWDTNDEYSYYAGNGYTRMRLAEDGLKGEYEADQADIEAEEDTRRSFGPVF